MGYLGAGGYRKAANGMSKPVRWDRARIDAYVKRRLARHADASFETEMASTSILGRGWSPQAAVALGKNLRRQAPQVPGTRLYPLVLLCEAHGLPLPQPEYNFSPTRGWRFDYAWIAQKIAVEVEGGIWRRGGGAHSHPQNIERDIEKYNAAAVLGWRVLRVVPEKLASIIEPLKAILL